MLFLPSFQLKATRTVTKKCRTVPLGPIAQFPLARGLSLAPSGEATGLGGQTMDLQQIPGNNLNKRTPESGLSSQTFRALPGLGETGKPDKK